MTLSKDLIALTVDDTPMLVRRANVIRAIEETSKLRARLQSRSDVDVDKAALPSPFVYLSRRPSREPTSVRLRKEVVELAADDAECAASASFLTNLSPGEYFALSSLLKTKQEVPVAPQVVTSVPGLNN